jgi:hypothetical protein
MDAQPYRLDSLSIVPSIARQTPNNDFGTVLARTTREVLAQGAGFLSPIAPAAPVLSAAVTGMGEVASRTLAASPVNAVSSSVPSLGSTGKGESWDLLEAQRGLQNQGASLNVQYLQLQEEMQRESREFNAITNILKVRHDSAKAAINNIR